MNTTLWGNNFSQKRCKLHFLSGCSWHQDLSLSTICLIFAVTSSKVQHPSNLHVSSDLLIRITSCCRFHVLTSYVDKAFWLNVFPPFCKFLMQVIGCSDRLLQCVFIRLGQIQVWTAFMCTGSVSHQTTFWSLSSPLLATNIWLNDCRLSWPKL